MIVEGKVSSIIQMGETNLGAGDDSLLDRLIMKLKEKHLRVSDKQPLFNFCMPLQLRSRN